MCLRGLRIAALLLLPAILPAQDLKLIPAPREVKAGQGTFAVGSGARILISAATADEDRAAAEAVADEIEGVTGVRPAIATSRAFAAQAGAIYLLRLDGDKALEGWLEGQGLTLDAAHAEEGYLLGATPRNVVVAAAGAAGLFYGAQTLRQLLHPAETQGEQREGEWRRGAAQMAAPAVNIRDWPAMRWRGIHDDISRGPVPTLDYIKLQIRTIAQFKLNLYSLYIEHTFDYQGHPLIGPKEGALTAAEVKEIVEYARRYHVTVLPEQQAFGHLHHVLKYEKYAPLGETPHGHVLAPVQEGSYELVKSLVDELIPLFPGPLFHIGADETFELGQGQTKARAEEVGLGRVYLEHVRRVAEIMKPHNKRLLFWHDIAVKYPESLDILPKDIVAVAWDYGARDNFESELKPFRNNGLALMVSPGASNWNRIHPDLESAYLNIRNFVRDGQKYGALGMLNTTWDDDGEAIFGMTWPAIVFGAAASWQPGESSIDAFRASYDWAFYRNNDATFREAIDNLARAQSLLTSVGLGSFSNDMHWADPFTEVSARRLAKALPAAAELRLAAERALEALYRHRAKARANTHTLDALIFAAMRLDALGMKIQFMQEINKFYWDAYLNQADRARVRRNLAEITGINARLEDLRDSTTRLRDHYTSLWLQENRPYWLGNVQVRYDVLAALYQRKIQEIKAARWQFAEQGTLPEPASLGLFLKP
jgi:hypothetical protein